MTRTSGLATADHHRRPTGMRRLAVLTASLGALALLGLAPAASARTLIDTTISATGQTAQSCFQRDLSSEAGVDARSLSVAPLAMVEARLDGDPGDDWDLAIIDRQSGGVVAASAHRGSSEVASGFALGDERFVVQACRRSGEGDARLTFDTTRIDLGGEDPIPPQLVKVDTPMPEDKELLEGLGLDLTEHAGDGFVTVVLYGLDDVALLKANGFDYTVLIENLVAQARQDRAADARFSAARSAAASNGSSLPSGRTTYRRLFHYSEELKQLAKRNPNIVKPITLPLETYEGRPVEGIEITRNPQARDGKPVFLQMGIHHAREWPSGEHAMEWAHELIKGFRRGNDRVRRLVRTTRTIVVPVVNPDGFNLSRETGQLQAAGNGRDSSSYADVLAQLVVYGQEFHRKNCRYPEDNELEGGNCPPPGSKAGNGIESIGVDPNRNYGAFWGGPGNSDVELDADYRGPGPFSEPESENVRRLVSRRQVTTLITNHTFSNLVLRPPGVAGEPDAPDEPLYKRFGAEMTDENGYANLKGFELYDTTGTTEDWTYWVAGPLSFTFEIGCEARFEGTEECDYGNFHGPFQDVVAEYRGTTDFAGSGGGNRAAYFRAQESTANARRHSVVGGRAPKDAVLRIQKTFRTDTWCSAERRQDSDECQGRDEQPFRDHLETAIDVSDTGEFEWHINPSTRPVIAQERGRPAEGDPSDPESFSGSPSGAQPCVDYDTTDPRCWNDHAFTVPEGPGIDNARVSVRIEWKSPSSDWDMKVFVDSDGDGSSEGEKKEVASSGQGITNFEQATFAEPTLKPGQKYVARVINYAAVEPYEGTVTYEGPEEFVAGDTESWELTCERGGRVQTSQQLFIDRGERVALDLRAACARAAGDGRARCNRKRATLVGTSGDDRLRGTQGRDVIVARGGDDVINGFGGDDRICGGGGEDHVRGGSGDDDLFSQGADDWVAGGRGDDRILTGGGDDASAGGAGFDRMVGMVGNDRLRGKGGDDRLFGRRGDDALRGGSGDDVLKGGRGNDDLTGGSGKDRLRGGPGDDTERE